MCTSRRPSWCVRRFCFFVASNKKIVRIRGQFLEVTHVPKRRFHIKKYRLVLWVHGIQRLIRRNHGINFSGSLLHLLPVPQDHRREWITNRSNDESKSDKERNYFSPCSLAYRLYFQRPLQRMPGVAH